MGFGNKFKMAIKVLYTDPVTQFWVNGVQTSINTSTTWDKGVLCPRCYLQLVLLAITIRDNTDTVGIKIQERDYILAMFSDDLIIFLTNPIHSLDNLQNILRIFGHV